MFLPTRTRRPGFTLVELMVSAAVCVIIMAVLSTVFQSGIDVMRDMRSVGSLQDQLRAATEMIRRDLQADHFVPRDSRTIGHLISGPRLSDQWPTDPAWQPPVGGFFHIESDKTGAIEADDSDSLHFAKSGANAVLHFTSILPGDKPQNLYSVSCQDTLGAPHTLSSPAAEVCYFVDHVTMPTNHRLIRRQRLIASKFEDSSMFQNKDASGEVIAGNPGTVHTLSNISANRLSPSKTMLSGPRTGDDVLLSNIRLFEVKVNWDGTPPGRPFTSPGGPTDAPFDYLNGSGGLSTFDTSVNTNRLRVKGLQIRIRIYDPQMQTTRQVTIVQDM